MTQPELFHESIGDALAAAVAALGGPKKVGATMRPELPVDQAAGWIRDCLNPGRRESFHPEHVQLLLRECRKVGFHGLAAFMLRDAHYRDPEPIEVEDARAQLQRQYVEAVQAMAGIAREMERLAQMPAASTALRAVGQ